MAKRFIGGLLILLLVLGGGSLKGQVRSGHVSTDVEDADNTVSNPNWKPKFSLGVGVGISDLFGNLSTPVSVPAGRIGLGCRVTKNLVVGVEVYGGQLSSSEAANSWSSGFHETSTFESIDLNAKITLGDYMKYPNNEFMKLLSGAYIGSGYGLVYSNATQYKGYFSNKYPELNQELHKGYFTTKSVFCPYVPLNIGLRVHMKNLFGNDNTQLMLNYQINYTFTDNLAVYNFSTLAAANLHKSCYSVATIGFSFHITKD